MINSGEIVAGLGGARIRGITLPVAPNNNPVAQTDPRLRALNEGPSTPGPREEVYCTKVGTTRPDEMYIVGAHMDGRGFGKAAVRAALAARRRTTTARARRWSWSSRAASAAPMS